MDFQVVVADLRVEQGLDVVGGIMVRTPLGGVSRMPRCGERVTVMSEYESGIAGIIQRIGDVHPLFDADVVTRMGAAASYH